MHLKREHVPASSNRIAPDQYERLSRSFKGTSLAIHPKPLHLQSDWCWQIGGGGLEFAADVDRARTEVTESIEYHDVIRQRPGTGRARN